MESDRGSKENPKRASPPRAHLLRVLAGSPALWLPAVSPWEPQQESGGGREERGQGVSSQSSPRIAPSAVPLPRPRSARDCSWAQEPIPLLGPLGAPSVGGDSPAPPVLAPALSPVVPRPRVSGSGEPGPLPVGVKFYRNTALLPRWRSPCDCFGATAAEASSPNRRSTAPKAGNTVWSLISAFRSSRPGSASDPAALERLAVCRPPQGRWLLLVSSPGPLHAQESLSQVPVFLGGEGPERLCVSTTLLSAPNRSTLAAGWGTAARPPIPPPSGVSWDHSRRTSGSRLPPRAEGAGV